MSDCNCDNINNVTDITMDVTPEGITVKLWRSDVYFGYQGSFAEFTITEDDMRRAFPNLFPSQPQT